MNLFTKELNKPEVFPVQVPISLATFSSVLKHHISNYYKKRIHFNKNVASLVFTD